MSLDRRQVLQLLGWHALAPMRGASLFGGAAPRGAAQAEARLATDVDLTLTALAGEVPILSGAPTRVWRFSATLNRGPASTLESIPGSYLGPILRVRRGQRLRVRFRNELEEPSIVHWHGLDVPERADGHPRLAIDSGREYVYDFEVTNRAGTYWYHPHPHMRTAAQVYRGMAGLLLVSDPEEEALQLPAGAGELTWVLQDRRFDHQNQLVYASGMPEAPRRRSGRGRGMGQGMGGGMAQMMETINGWLGDRVLVNGQSQPSVEVARRTYRVRLLNGSNARIYKLAWSDGTPFTVIGGDGGLLERMRVMRALTLAPGQRADLLLDLTDRPAGATLRLRSLAFPATAVGRVGMMGDPAPLPQGSPIEVITLTVSRGTGPRVRLPERLCTPPDQWRPDPAAPVRRVPLAFMRMEWLLGGRTFEIDGVAPDETVAAGSTHVWELVNQPNPMGMAMAHPIHVHGTQFRVLSRSGADGNPLQEGLSDTAATDTVLVLPGQTVRVQLTFSRHPGLYLYHCHILEHEDMGMMRNFRITSRT
jgi:FtsP/CotA-like multicopper oxidase with cupredoxin domain